MEPSLEKLNPLEYLQTAAKKLEAVFGGRCFVRSIDVEDETGLKWAARLRQPCRPSIYLSVTTHYNSFNPKLPTYTVAITEGNTEVNVPYALHNEFMQVLGMDDYSYFKGSVFSRKNFNSKPNL